MRLGTVLTPPSAENFELAAQCGVVDFVSRYPGKELAELQRVQNRAAEFGLKLAVIEGYLPIEKIKTGEDDGSELEELKLLIRHMGESGLSTLCYNFMSGTDWVRTQVDAVERGGALVTKFDLSAIEEARDLGAPSAALARRDAGENPPALLWDRLAKLLDELLPVAEDANVTLAMHPDDPPLPCFLGRHRIMYNVAGFDRLLQLAPSPSNGICFCQGTFAEMGADIPATIRHFGSAIKYVHFRDVRGTADHFTETFHDNGPTDMVAAMAAYQHVGFTGTIRPDHVPQLSGESDGEPGYTMRGRLFAYGYMRGLIQATYRG
jgi:mannonate dehydratase